MPGATEQRRMQSRIANSKHDRIPAAPCRFAGAGTAAPYDQSSRGIMQQLLLGLSDVRQLYRLGITRQRRPKAIDPLTQRRHQPFRRGTTFGPRTRVFNSSISSSSAWSAFGWQYGSA